MRPNNYTLSTQEYKRKSFDYINQHILASPKDRISFVMEDDDRIVEMWRSLGLTCFQPRGSSY